MPWRCVVGDAVGILDELSLERAHFIGMSWGGRLGFGIGEHAPERVLSLIIGGQQPYEWPDSPITRAVSQGLAAARAKGAEGVVEALEAFWNIRFPDERRARWVANDAAALEAAWTTALSEGPAAHDLRAWQVPCLIFMGAADNDFMEQAQRAAKEIPSAEFLALGEANHYAAHTSSEELLLDAVLRTLRANS
jgi:pimeloyl-ACP methyl ester carboxylesterase